MANTDKSESQTEWAPHAEKEFGRLTHAISKTLPRKLTATRRLGRQIVAMTATTNKKR
ncbi:MAG TPA: hypothetical protein VNC18_17525 [Gemmatimonadaceae bacterium]|nr:hypothetical protein [Gemmatimonadaceae bacterium]